MIADELRRQADEFVDITQLVNVIGRDPAERAERLQRAQNYEERAERHDRDGGGTPRRGLERRYGIRQSPAGPAAGEDDFAGN